MLGAFGPHVGPERLASWRNLEQAAVVGAVVAARVVVVAAAVARVAAAVAAVEVGHAATAAEAAAAAGPAAAAAAAAADVRAPAAAEAVAGWAPESPQIELGTEWRDITDPQGR